jgi:hypothetical protein
MFRRRRPHLGPDLVQQLMAVEPSVDGVLEYRPCQVGLVDGTTRDRVYVQEAASWLSHWGVDPEDDEGKHLVPIDFIVSIAASPTRLPARFANTMYAAGESAMGGCIFRLALRDGRYLDYMTGNAVDFLHWPPGTGPDDVVDLLPHHGHGTRRLDQPDYSWALYDR